jgi:hypothetical protein
MGSVIVALALICQNTIHTRLMPQHTATKKCVAVNIACIRGLKKKGYDLASATQVCLEKGAKYSD